MRAELWARAEGLGLRGVLVPEQHGGSGGDLSDLAAALEGFGRHALPLPFLAAHGVVPWLLTAAGPRGCALLPAVATGTIRAVPVLDALAGWHRTRPGTQLSCRVVDGRVAVRGTAVGVEDVPDATHHLLGVRGASGEPVLVLVPVSVATSATPRTRLDDRTTVDLSFDGLVDRDAVLASAADADAAVTTALGLATLLSCVEVVAALGALVGETVTYLSERHQFDVPLATFQVLRHHVADMYLAYDNLAALTDRTVRAAAERGLPDPETVALLGVRRADASRQVATTAIQLHGGMGVTEELHATRLVKRLLMSAFEYGDGAFHADHLVTIRGART
jgi:alkylation response protein AidB-like acyl-CoA dehydrogenase